MIKKTIRGILVCSILFFGTLSLQASVVSSAQSVSHVVKTQRDSVVSILVRSTAQLSPPASFFRKRGGFHFFSIPGMGQFSRPARRGEGSGVIYDSKGLILTNAHVVSGADEILVTLADGRKFSARVKSTNPSFDLAVIEIDDPSFSGKLEEKFLSKFGDSDQLEVGDVVIAIGSPYSLDGTVTAGIVSAKGRTLKNGEFGQYSNLIQTDASINPGNSGGPLLNLKGEVVGINTAMSRGGQGLGFAIPINLASRMTSDVKQFGKVKQSWLGIMIQDVDWNTAPYLGLKSPKGILIQKVLKDTPAMEGGLQQGDVILEINGQTVGNRHVLIEKIQEVPVHEEVEIKILRQKTPMELRIRVGEKGEEFLSLRKADEKPSVAGLRARMVDEDTRRELALPEKSGGVYIQQVESGSLMDQAGVKSGDILLQVNGRNLKELEDLRHVDEMLEREISLNLLLIRSGKVVFAEVNHEKG